MQFFKPLSTLLVGAVIGTFLGPKLLVKVRG
jgi:hypothetical protein